MRILLYCEVLWRAVSRLQPLRSNDAGRCVSLCRVTPCLCGTQKLPPLFITISTMDTETKVPVTSDEGSEDNAEQVDTPATE